MSKPSPTQRKILENAAGIANHYPFGRSQHGGWSGAIVACHRRGWFDSRGEITTAGLTAIDAATCIVLTVADHEKNGFVSLATTGFISEKHARSLIASIDRLVDPEAEPTDDAAFAFILDLMKPNGDCVDTGDRRLPLQVAMTLAPEAVSQWLDERPVPDEVMHRAPMTLTIERLQANIPQEAA